MCFLSATCVCPRLSAAFVCHCLGTVFIYRRDGTTFICVRAIQTSKIYLINDNKSNQ